MVGQCDFTFSRRFISTTITNANQFCFFEQTTILNLTVFSNHHFKSHCIFNHSLEIGMITKCPKKLL